MDGVCCFFIRMCHVLTYHNIVILYFKACREETNTRSVHTLFRGPMGSQRRESHAFHSRSRAVRVQWDNCASLANSFRRPSGDYRPRCTHSRSFYAFRTRHLANHDRTSDSATIPVSHCCRQDAHERPSHRAWSSPSQCRRWSYGVAACTVQ